MKHKRGTLLTGGALLVALMLLIGLTVAYATDFRQTQNVLGIGRGNSGDPSLLISLTEPSFTVQALGKNGTVEYLSGTTDEPTRITVPSLVPGDYIYKDPVVKNIGNRDVYIRFKIDGFNMNQASTPGTVAYILTQQLGLQINTSSATTDGFYYLPADGYFYYVTRGNNAQCASIKSANLGGPAIDLFKPITGTRPFQATMQIKPGMSGTDIDSLMAALDAAGLINPTTKAFKMTVTVEAIQADYFNGAIPWVNEGTNTPVTVQAALSR